MSAEEDAELKNLVAQTLENKGILPKIRAELRANVFLALEENPITKETLLKNDELSAFVKIPIGTLILNLVREFLEFFELEFTLSVFDPETKYGAEYNSLEKDKIMKDLKLTECKNKTPLLYKVVEKLINSDDLRVLSSGKQQENSGLGDASENGDTGQLQSPMLLNSTYVKAKEDVEFIPLSPIVKEGSGDENDTIKEELISNNISDSDSLAELNLDKSPKLKNPEENSQSNSIKDSKVKSPAKNPEESSQSNSIKDSKSKSPAKNPEEIDFLIFTPVKENKTKEKPDAQSQNKEFKISKVKETEKSVLGDLPPLSIKAEEKGNKISTIKAIIDKWPGSENEDESSLESKSSNQKIKEDKSLKSDRSDNSQKSEQTESADDFEEDISDLLNGHTPSEEQITIDETISRVSGEADYLEGI